MALLILGEPGTHERILGSIYSPKQEALLATSIFPSYLVHSKCVAHHTAKITPCPPCGRRGLDTERHSKDRKHLIATAKERLSSCVHSG